jgi:hypothetical protein
MLHAATMKLSSDWHDIKARPDKNYPHRQADAGVYGICG